MRRRLVILKRQSVISVKKWDTLQKHAKQNKTLDRNHTKELEGHITYVNDSQLQGSELEEHTPTTTDSSYNLFTITAGGQNPILLQVTINQTPVQMELDTGASLSLINKQTFDVIADHSHITLRTTDVHLKTYTGEALEILGEADVTVNYGEKK